MANQLIFLGVDRNSGFAGIFLRQRDLAGPRIDEKPDGPAVTSSADEAAAGLPPLCSGQSTPSDAPPTIVTMKIARSIIA